jgi:hypothetical protein
MPQGTRTCSVSSVGLAVLTPFSLPGDSFLFRLLGWPHQEVFSINPKQVIPSSLLTHLSTLCCPSLRQVAGTWAVRDAGAISSLALSRWQTLAGLSVTCWLLCQPLVHLWILVQILCELSLMLCKLKYYISMCFGKTFSISVIR